MYEKILEILHEILCVGNRFAGQEESAKEIYEMFRKFVEWILSDSNVYQTADKKYFVNLYLNEVNKKYYTLDELFDYWYEEIREK